MADLTQIRHFLAVCDRLNFTRAAEDCGITQPALTRSIKRLEQELGGLLFRRERAKTHMTDLAQVVHPHFTRVLEESDAANEAAEAFLSLKQASLSVGLLESIGARRFQRFIAKFVDSYPGVEMEVSSGNLASLRQRLLDGAIDVAILSNGDPFEERFICQKLYDEPFHVCLPDNHRLASQSSVALKDLEGETLITRTHCEWGDRILDTIAEASVDVETAYRSDHDEWIETMILAGAALAIVPSNLSVQPGLLLRPLVEPTIEREVLMATVSGRRYSPSVLSFIQALKTHNWASAPARMLRTA